MNVLVPLALASAAAYVLYKRAHPAVPTPDQAGASALPPALQGAYSALLLNGTDPTAIDVVAAQLDTFGYAQQAAALRAKSAALRASGATPAQAPAIAPAVAPTVAPAAAAPAAPAATISGWHKYPDGRVRHATSKLLFSGGAFQEEAAGIAFRGAEHQAFGAVSTLQPGVAFGAQTRPGSRAGRAYTPKQPVAALVQAPAGARLRTQPHGNSAVIGTVPHGAKVFIRQHVAGHKSDVTSKGPGGSAYVRHDRIEGWMPSEWLEPLGANT